jgi:hypothetical protein
VSGDFPYLPVSAKGWRLAMGLRPLEESKWLEVDGHRDEQLAQKHELLRDSRDVVVATRDEGLDASAELLEYVTAFLRDHHPGIALEVDPDEHPIVAAARLVQEDLCVMVKDDAWRLQAACVCFPSRWRLVGKIGTTLDDIHTPIPNYHEELSRPTNSFFDRLGPERSFWRLNWTVLDSPELHQPIAARQSPKVDFDKWFFRVERQTLRQLARTKGIVFTIHNYVESLATLIATNEEFAGNLLLALDTAPEAMNRYKGWVGLGDQLREVRSSRSSGARCE